MEKERYQEQLSATERRLDRFQSKAAAALNTSSRSLDEDDGVKEELKEIAKAENGEPSQSPQWSPKAVS